MIPSCEMFNEYMNLANTKFSKEYNFFTCFSAYNVNNTPQGYYCIFSNEIDNAKNSYFINATSNDTRLDLVYYIPTSSSYNTFNLTEKTGQWIYKSTFTTERTYPNIFSNAFTTEELNNSYILGKTSCYIEEEPVEPTEPVYYYEQLAFRDSLICFTCIFIIFYIILSGLFKRFFKRWK